MNNAIQDIKVSQIDRPADLSLVQKNSQLQQDLQPDVVTLQMAQFAAAKSNVGLETTNPVPSTIQRFQPRRFAVGLCCTTSGVALILGVGLRVVEMQEISNDFAMPLVALCVLTGVMLLGGGFGIMATSSSGFDEAEFDRLAAAGNISAVSQTRGEDQGGAVANVDAHDSAA